MYVCMCQLVRDGGLYGGTFLDVLFWVGTEVGGYVGRSEPLLGPTKKKYIKKVRTGEGVGFTENYPGGGAQGGPGPLGLRA